MLLAAIHRIGNVMPTSVMTSNVEIPSDDLKGKIIGKEGRNVRAFERATGVDVLIDETPGYIVLSSFDPIRREIARVALEALMKDGRIQPAKIEEAVELARKEVATSVRKMGEKACYDANVPNLHPDLISIVGRLHFRTSYGQNVLWHSVEMAHMAAIIAEEVGADVAVARAGALLHDIGKLVLSSALNKELSSAIHDMIDSDQCTRLQAEKCVLGVDHAEVGASLLEKWQLPACLVEAVRHHHRPVCKPEPMLSAFVHIANCMAHQPDAAPDAGGWASRADEDAVASVGIDAEGYERALLAVREQAEMACDFAATA